MFSRRKSGKVEYADGLYGVLVGCSRPGSVKGTGWLDSPAVYSAVGILSGIPMPLHSSCRDGAGKRWDACAYTPVLYLYSTVSYNYPKRESSHRKGGGKRPLTADKPNGER